MKNLTNNEINVISGGLQCIESAYVDIYNTSDSSILFRVECTQKHDGDDSCMSVMADMERRCHDYNEKHKNGALKSRYIKGCFAIAQNS